MNIRKGAPASAKVDEDLIPTQFNGIALHPVGRLLHHFAGCDVVLPAVPRTTYHRAVELPFAERPAVMQAYTIDCKQLTINVGYGYGLPADRDLADLARGDFVDFGCALECHSSALLQTEGEEYSATEK